MRPETKEEETTWETYDGEDVSEAFALNGTQLLYQGKAILSGIPEAYTEKQAFWQTVFQEKTVIYWLLSCIIIPLFLRPTRLMYGMFF